MRSIDKSCQIALLIPERAIQPGQKVGRCENGNPTKVADIEQMGITTHNTVSISRHCAGEKFIVVRVCGNNL